MTQRKHLHLKKAHSYAALQAIAVVLFVSLMGGIVGIATTQSALAADTEVLSAADVYEQNVNSTVGITTSAQVTNAWGYTSSRSAAGSGFIITEDGYILTNYHVIEDSDSVKVATYSGESYEAEIIGYDESNDIAVLKIEAQGLQAVRIGNSDELRVGEEVLAIGNPLGELTFSLTKGIVSALNRDVTIESGISMKLIQTDCAINSGNSGGALFNTKGEVIGITNAKYSSSSSGTSVDNIGFAIPINTLVKIYNSIIENGYILKPYIGISGQDVSEDVKQITGLTGGARVVVVEEDTPAEKAGLQTGDVIISADGKNIETFSDLADLISASEPGDQIVFTVYRQGQTLDITIEIGAKTQAAIEEEEEPEEDDQDYGNYQNGQGGQYGYGQGGQGYGDYFFGDGGMSDFFNYYFGR